MCDLMFYFIWNVLKMYDIIFDIIDSISYMMYLMSFLISYTYEIKD